MNRHAANDDLGQPITTTIRWAMRPALVLLGLLLLGLLLLGGSLTQELSAQNTAEQLRRSFWLQGRQMRRAFGEVVEQPRHGTVKILSDQEVLALGTIVAADGWIVTKASQINQATHCQFSDGQRLSFEYVGYDLKLDLALLKVEREDLVPIAWSSAEPAVGEWVVTANSEAIPVAVGVISTARRHIPGSASRGVLGIQLERQEQAIIERVFPNSAAASAGLTSGDLILRVNQKEIQGNRQLVETIGTYRPGDTITLQIRRGEEMLTLPATLTHPFGDFLSRIAFQEQMGGPLSFRRDDFEAVYQHDTVLRPEQCGGPLLNLDGEAIGINIARASRTSSYALPADLIVKRLEALKSGDYPPPIPEVAGRPESPTEQATSADNAPQSDDTSSKAAESDATGDDDQ